jgi:DNA polymerase III alpha subunit
MYSELHCHSAFSFLDGASPPDEVLAEAHRLGYPALALTDRNGVYGSLAFAHAARALGIQAITGAEVSLTDGNNVVLLAESAQGYSNLCRLLTGAHLGAERLDPRLALSAIADRQDGLIILSGSRRDGLLPHKLQQEGLNATRYLAAHCKAMFGPERFFIEVQRNLVRGDMALSRGLIGIAEDLGFARWPLAASTTTSASCTGCTTSWSPSGTGRHSMARIGSEIRTASFTCGHWTKSCRCSVTVRMLSPLHWRSLSGVRPSI